MKSPMCFAVVAFIFSLICFPAACSSNIHQDFVHCLSSKLRNNATSQVLYTPSSPSFLPILNMSAQNSRFTGPGTPKPVVIITPLRESHVRAALICSRKYNIQLRTRSGGHDYEGVSFVSTLPFAILDLIKFRLIKVNVGEKSAWVQTGATLGELYYSIANKSDTLAFPAGICPTVGTGGHISGGGYGMLLRKYGLAADHVIDARIMDVNGRILDRKSMGEDLFWAIRGGGGASFGIILSWKLELVPVPETVTVFNISKTLEQNLTNLLYKWQFFANKADRNLYLRVVLQNTNTTGERTVEGLFNAQYLGRSEALLAMMQKGFPELGVTKSDLTDFMNNFYRLAKVKALVDPDNFFRNEQSIIPLSYPL